MACCCAPQACLCSTPSNGAKATQVVAEFSDFTGGAGVRASWSAFATTAIPNFLNGLAVYAQVLDPQPSWTPSGQVVYGFSQTYANGNCELLGVSLFLQYKCSDGSSGANSQLFFSFKKDSTAPSTGTCGWAPSGINEGSYTLGDRLWITNDCNVCTNAAGTLRTVTFNYVVGYGSTFDTTSYSGKVKLTPQ